MSLNFFVLILFTTGLFILITSHSLGEKDLPDTVNPKPGTVRIYLLIHLFNKYLLKTCYEPSVSIGLTSEQSLRQGCSAGGLSVRSPPEVGVGEGHAVKGGAQSCCGHPRKKSPCTGQEGGASIQPTPYWLRVTPGGINLSAYLQQIPK